MSLCNNEVIEAYRSALHKPFMPQHRASDFEIMHLGIRQQFPQGVDAVVYCKSAVQGWSQMPATNGIIAILIGLLNPPSAREDGSGMATGRRQYAPFLKPTGAIGFARDLDGQMAGFVFHTITWE